MATHVLLHSRQQQRRTHARRKVGLLAAALFLLLAPTAAAATRTGSLVRVKSDDGGARAVEATSCDLAGVEQAPNALAAGAPGNAKHGERGQAIGSTVVFICDKGFEGWKGTRPDLTGRQSNAAAVRSTPTINVVASSSYTGCCRPRFPRGCLTQHGPDFVCAASVMCSPRARRCRTERLSELGVCEQRGGQLGVRAGDNRARWQQRQWQHCCSLESPGEVFDTSIPGVQLSRACLGKRASFS